MAGMPPSNNHPQYGSQGGQQAPNPHQAHQHQMMQKPHMPHGNSVGEMNAQGHHVLPTNQMNQSNPNQMNRNMYGSQNRQCRGVSLCQEPLPCLVTKPSDQVCTRASMGPPNTEVPLSQNGFMQSIMDDRSSAFRSHPLFPLLRDLIIADMNFHTPSFPIPTDCYLPADFDRLLNNYLSRNPPVVNYPTNDGVQSVIMDALKYAHSALMVSSHQHFLPRFWF